MSNRRWTVEETQRLRVLIEDEGKTYREAGEILGRCRMSCLGAYNRDRVRRGHVPEPRKWTQDAVESIRVLKRDTPKPKPSLATSRPENAVGFILPAIPASSRQTRAVGILDATGCKWPIADNHHLIGGIECCNHTPKDGRPYCEYHTSMSRASYSTTLIRETIKGALHVYKRAAA